MRGVSEVAGKDIFLSVGSPANDEQERFIAAIEERLRSEGLIPHTVGRNTFSSDAPLKTIEKLMDSCVGTVVVALERSFFTKGKEKRGGDREKDLIEVCLATPWNQIEAAMSYARGLPLLVIVQEGVRSEGLLEPGYDWYVQRAPLDINALNTKQFNGVLSSWKDKLGSPSNAGRGPTGQIVDLDNLTVGQILSAMKPMHLASVFAGLAAIASASFALGAQFFP